MTVNKLMLITFFFMSLTTLPLYAQNAQKLDSMSLDELEEMSEGQKPKTFSYRDSKTGLLKRDFDLSRDKHRFNFLYHLNNDFSSLTDLQTLEANYSFKLDSLWIEMFVSQVSAQYSEIFDTTSVSLEQGQSNDTIQAFGVGLSYQSKWVQNFVNNERMFTTTAASLGYYTYENSLTSQSFTGFGLKSDFGLHIRQSPKFHYGIKISYNLAPMTREAEFEGEPSSARSLTASWLSLAFDVGLYF